MMPPAINVTGNPPLKAAEQKDFSREKGGAAAFASFMLWPPDKAAVDADQALVATAATGDDISGGEHADELALDEDDTLLMSPPVTVADPPELATPQGVTFSTEDGLTVSDAAPNEVVAGIKLAMPRGRAVQLAQGDGPTPEADPLSMPDEVGAAAIKPDRENPSSGAAGDAVNRPSVKAAIAAEPPSSAPRSLAHPSDALQSAEHLSPKLTSAIPQSVEPPSAGPPDFGPDKEPSGIAAEIRLQVGVEAKGDIATATLSVPRNAPQLAQNILRQIGSHVADQQGGQIEITLTPEELGRVRLVMSGGERPAVAVYAENPATLDLLRRHADLLARELRDTGLAGADLSFADNSGAGHRHAAADRDDHARFAPDRGTPRAEIQMPMARPRTVIGSLIDIRI